MVCFALMIPALSVLWFAPWIKNALPKGRDTFAPDCLCAGGAVAFGYCTLDTAMKAR
jgi:hypothetical protein